MIVMGHTIDEISQVVEISKDDAQYHMRLLQAGRLVYKRKSVYHISNEGVRILNMFGITDELVKKCAREIDIEIAEENKYAKHNRA